MATQTVTASSRHEAIDCCKSSLLGQAYPGRPIGLALRMSNLEQAGNPAKARALLDAHTRTTCPTSSP